MQNRFKPSVTVAALIEDAKGRFLLVEENTPEGPRLNQPAGHLEQSETPEAACAREVREETARVFVAQAFLGVYLGRFQRTTRVNYNTTNRNNKLTDIQSNIEGNTSEDISYVRLAFCGSVGDEIAGEAYDTEIIRTLWLTPDEIRKQIDTHRSPLVLLCIEDYLQGRRLPLEVVRTHESVLRPLSS